MSEINQHFDNSSAIALIPEVNAERMRRVFRRFMSPFAPTSRVTVKYALSRVADGLGILSVDGDIETLPWHTITADSFSDLIMGWQSDLEAPTIRLYMHSLRGLARACYLDGLMTPHQYTLIKEVKLPKGKNKVGRGRAVERHYFQQIMKSCREDERLELGSRDAALFAVIFGTGMRRAEAASIDCHAVNISEAEIRVKTKGNNLTVKYVQAWAIPFIENWMMIRLEKGVRGNALFTRVQKNGVVTDKRLTGRGIMHIMEERSKVAGLPFIVRPHDGRRTVGTQMIQEHGELIAQRVLGHADLSTTRIYDKRDDSIIKQIFRGQI